MVMKMWEFWHKISYNLAYVTDMAKNLAPNRFQGRWNFDAVSSKYVNFDEVQFFYKTYT